MINKVNLDHAITQYNHLSKILYKKIIILGVKNNLYIELVLMEPSMSII